MKVGFLARGAWCFGGGLLATIATSLISPPAWAATTEEPAASPPTASATRRMTPIRPHLAQQPMASNATGKFQVFYAPLEDQTYAALQQVFQDSQVFEAIANELNKTIALPHDLTIVLGTCGQENAFYSAENKQIVICNELIGRLAVLFSQSEKSEQEIGEAIVNTTLFIFFHEMGHALIDVLNLPTTGREEDVVDEFSTLLLLAAGEDGEKAVINAAEWFLIEGSKNDAIEKLAFWDEHSLDLQRFYGILCLVYGKAPDKYSFFLQKDLLPESRAAACVQDYAKKEKSWDALLAPYLRN
jgi:hypothetical protein